MASASSQAAHSTSAPLRKHDVFLSFYGKDTRKGFADHLYTAMKATGIFVFRDNEELKREENISEILKAIQESEYAVVIISKNYALSKWCLRELTEIVKCKREYSLTILPIFYYVDPSNLRNQKGSFADGLAIHGEESKEEKEKWRSALNEVGNIGGWHVHDSYESKIIREICREILVGLNRRLSINFKDVVGIESQVKEMMTLLRARDNANNVHFIGICGMRGIGKTTLAQVIFDTISYEFEATCFVDDIREKLKRIGIVHLQEQIISKILGDRDIKIQDCFDGIRVMANRLQDKKVLIVLDNVDKASQIKALANSSNWFGQGSIVLLTSKDRQLLKRFVDKIYKLEGLSDNDALQLFCLKAFKKNYPPKNYLTLSKKFVNYAEGHPLALKVFGSLLLRKELPVWENTLKWLKEEPHVEILDKLIISFYALSNSQQELFLDVACFFNREPIDNVIQYLESLGRYPNANIEVLQDRSLIEVSHEIFEMHELLQEMGQQIVHEKSLKNPCEFSRLWSNKDIIYVLKNNVGTNAVEGIFLRLPLSKSVKLNFEGFSKMKRLKMLVIRPIVSYRYNTNNDETFKHLKTVEWYGDPSKFMLSNELRILEWWGYPLKSLPTNFEPANLITLKMPMSNIKGLWNVGKNFEKLKYIDLKDSRNLVKMPDFSGVSNLEKLNIAGTRIGQLLSSITLPKKIKFLYVGDSFQEYGSLLLHGLSLYLKFLGELNLSYCNLTDELLHNNLGSLSSIWSLDLSGNKFTGVDFVSKLSNLRDLRLKNCEMLKALPPRLLSRLHYIFLENCPSLTIVSDPRDVLTTSETLVAGDITLQGFYFGDDGKCYNSTHSAQSVIKASYPRTHFAAITWGPTLTSNMPGWFTSLPDISGMFQRRFEAERGCTSRQAAEASLYFDVVEELDGYSQIVSWGYALFIIYEVLELDSRQRKGEIHEVDEHGNFSSTIFPVFVCELEVQEINDQKFPVEYCRTLGKVPIFFQVPNVPSVGRNGVWAFINADCFQGAGLKWCEDLGLCSISISSLNAEIKECGGRLVLKHDLSECYEIIKSISPLDLDSETLKKALYEERCYVFGPIIPEEKRKERNEQKNCPSSTPSFSDPVGLLTSSDLSMARDITLEAFYFCYDGKHYRTCHLAESIINDWSPYLLQERHFASVTWGPTQTSDIPEWFSSLPNISRVLQCRFEAETNFEKLQHIDLRDLQNLVKMQDFSKISNLKKLDERGIGIIQLPSSIMEKLNILHVDGSFSKHNSIFLHNLSLYLKFLGKLHLSSCNLTDELLDNNLGSLSSIWSLDLSGNKFTRIDFASKLSNLTDLRLENCEMLKALPPRWSSRLYYIFLENCPSLTIFSDPRDILTTSETLVAGDITLQGFYFGYDSEHYCATHLAGSFIKVWCPGTHFAAVAWGPTLTSNIPKWFTCLPDISGMFQRRFEAERGCSSRQDAEASLYFDVVEELDGYSQIVSCWGYALFIIYEVLELDSCQRKGEIHEVDEHGNFSSTIFPVFVCELEVQEINDQKFPVEYCRTLGKVPIVFRVPNVPSVGRNGVWAFINADCFQVAGLKWCDDLVLCSISISSLNVEVKECGGRLVLKHDLSECYKIIKSISPHDLDLETLKKALFEETSYVFGPIMPEEKRKERKGQKHCPWLTPVFDPMGILSSSDLLMARDITPEAFYFGNDGKRYRTYHLAQSIISDRSPGRHFASVTWGPTQTTDIPEWFTSLPNISGVFQCRFEAERGCSSHQDAEASLYFDEVEDSGMFQCVLEEESSLRYYDVEEDPDGYPNIVSCWGYALFIVYEVFEVNSRQRKGETHEADEHENSSSTIFPVFTCELEVHEINDRKFPTEYSKTLGKVPIVFCVPDIPSDGRNGVWVFIDADCFQEAGLKCCSNLGLCRESIQSSSVN